MEEDYVVLALLGKLDNVGVLFELVDLLQGDLISRNRNERNISEEKEIDRYLEYLPDKDYASKLVEAIKSMDLKFPVTIVDTEVLDKDSLEKIIQEGYKGFKAAFFKYDHK